jgi:hydroxyethylthiazole kinase
VADPRRLPAFPVAAIAAALGRLRERAPLVHCLTNFVTMTDVANALVAVGAQPAMAHAREEVGEVARQADALVLNLGTPSPERIEAMLLAAAAARAAGRPIVFDPVRVASSAFRRAAARQLLDEARPAIVRGNAAEVVALAGGPVPAREEDFVVAAATLARARQAVVAGTGPRDVVTDGARAWAVGHGHSLLTAVTGTGDMVTALVAAFAAVEPDHVTAAAGALVAFGLAAEHAAARASGPGSFRMALIDALYDLTAETVAERGKVEGIEVTPPRRSTGPRGREPKPSR